jgi:hypothetical protein
VADVLVEEPGRALRLHVSIPVSAEEGGAVEDDQVIVRHALYFQVCASG